MFFWAIYIFRNGNILTRVKYNFGEYLPFLNQQDYFQYIYLFDSTFKKVLFKFYRAFIACIFHYKDDIYGVGGDKYLYFLDLSQDTPKVLYSYEDVIFALGAIVINDTIIIQALDDFYYFTYGDKEEDFSYYDMIDQEVLIKQMFHYKDNLIIITFEAPYVIIQDYITRSWEDIIFLEYIHFHKDNTNDFIPLHSAFTKQNTLIMSLYDPKSSRDKLYHYIIGFDLSTFDNNIKYMFEIDGGICNELLLVSDEICIGAGIKNTFFCFNPETGSIYLRYKGKSDSLEPSTIVQLKYGYFLFVQQSSFSLFYGGYD